MFGRGWGLVMEYRIAIFEKDKMYLERLAGFLRTYHKDSFNISLPEFEITDLEELKYDAIFIGDGMEAVMEDIADDTIIAFITGDNNNLDKLKIYKYQKPEQIYNQMIDICKNHKSADKIVKKDVEINNICLTTEEDEYGCYKVFKLSNDDIIDSVAIGMLSNNNIQGIANIIECKDSLKYKVTNKISLLDYLHRNNTEESKNNLLKIASNILNTMLSLDEYMLDSDRIVLNPDYVYIDERTLKCELIYYPLQFDKTIHSVTDTLKCVVDICNNIMDSIHVKNDESQNICETASDSVKNNKNEDSGGTEIFEELQKTARESIKMKEHTNILSESQNMPVLVRRKNGEQIIINRNIFKIGKDESYVDYCIKNNPTVSRNHADIIKKPDGYFIVDKWSLNHTFINGKRIEPKVYEKLEDGDLIQLADEVFEYKRQKIDMHKNED